MKKKLFALTLILTLMMGITCFAATFTAQYNGGTVTYSLNKVIAANKSSGVGSTAYDNLGYMQVVTVFGYGSDGVAMISASGKSAAVATTATGNRKGVVKYKGIHDIQGSDGKALVRYYSEV